MKRLVIGLSALALSACVQKIETPPRPAPAAHETQAAPRAPQAGVYVFQSEPAANTACIMKLDDNVVENAPGFHNVWLAPGCESEFSVLMILTGWEEMQGGGVRLIGAEGEPFGEFTRGADGLLRGVSGNDGKTYTLRLGE